MAAAYVVYALLFVASSNVKSAEVRGRFEQLGYDPIGNSTEEFAATIKADIEKFARIIKAAGIRIER